MEVNDIKNIWKDSFSEMEAKLGPKEIEAKLKIKSKTKSLMTKVKRSFQFELIFSSFIVVFAFIYIWPDINTNNQIFALAFVALFYLIIMLFVWNKYRKLKSITIVQDQLKPAMIRWIKILEKYVKFNKSRFTRYILLPFSIILGAALGMVLSAESEKVFEKLSQMDNWKMIVTVLLFFALYFLILPLSQYLNKKLYGQHLDEMKQCLKDLEEIDEPENE